MTFIAFSSCRDRELQVVLEWEDSFELFSFKKECLKRKLPKGEAVYARSKPYIVVFVSLVPLPLILPL